MWRMEWTTLLYYPVNRWNVNFTLTYCGFSRFKSNSIVLNTLQESNLVKVDVLLNDKPVSELAFIAHAAKAKSRGMEVTSKLKENLPRQQFAIKIQVSR
jgi:translation elongation factor EF-4